MGISVTHSFQSAKADGTDNTLVQPSDWNAAHTITCDSGYVLGNRSGSTGPVQEIGLANVAYTGNYADLAGTPATFDKHYSSLVTKVGDASLGTWSASGWQTAIDLANGWGIHWAGSGTWGHFLGVSGDAFYWGHNLTNAIDGTSAPTYDMVLYVNGALVVGGATVITSATIGGQSVAYASNAGYASHASTADSLTGGSAAPTYGQVGSYLLMSFPNNYYNNAFSNGNNYDISGYGGPGGTWQCMGGIAEAAYGQSGPDSVLFLRVG